MLHIAREVIHHDQIEHLIAQRLLTVPETKTVKNRMHIDIHVGDERHAVIEWCVAHGATKLWDGQQGPQTWVTLGDPEGNEFCVS